MGAILILLIVIGLIIWLAVRIMQGRIMITRWKAPLEDVLRQIIMIAMSILIGLWIQAIASLALEMSIEWFWIWIPIGGILAWIGYRFRVPLVFLVGLGELFTGAIQASFSVSREIQSGGILTALVSGGVLASYFALGKILESRSDKILYAQLLEIITLVALWSMSLFWGSLSSRGLWMSFNRGDILIWNYWQVWFLVGSAIAGYLILGGWDLMMKKISKDYISYGLWAMILLSLSLWSLVPIEYKLEAMEVVRTVDYPGFLFIPIIVMNLVYLLACAWQLYQGTRYKAIWRINLTIGALIVFTIQRYFDWFSNSFLDRSLFFILMGLVFLGVGYILERLRARLIDQVTE